MTETQPLLSVDLQGLAFGGRDILGPIRFDLAARETLALVGPSGIGKTTLLRVIAGLQTGFDGTCKMRGRAAMVFQEPTLLPWRTVAQNICVATGVPLDQAGARLDEVGLGDRLDDFPHQLSLGQQRRVALARAFAVKPDVLLMDEPFVSLDADLVTEMVTLLETLRANHHVAVILVTHVAQEVQRLADRVLMLGGSPAQIIDTMPNALLDA